MSDTRIYLQFHDIQPGFYGILWKSQRLDCMQVIEEYDGKLYYQFIGDSTEYTQYEVENDLSIIRIWKVDI